MEKVSIVERLLLILQELGVERVIGMPETFGIIPGAKRAGEEHLSIEVGLMDMRIFGDWRDAYKAAENLRKEASVIVVIGDDGTNRIVAKACGDTPKLSLQLVQNYTMQTPYGRKILYYKLPPESTIVQEHIEKVHPVRTDVDLDWFIAYYRQAAELTFTEVVQTDMRMRELLKKVEAGNYTKETISEIFTLLDKREELWGEIYKFAEEKEKLQTIQTLKETGRKQILIASATGIEPLAIHLGGIVPGCTCPYLTCYDSYGIAPTLPGASHPLDASSAPYVYYRDFYPVAVWVGIYQSIEPNINYFWGDYCTYEFPNTETDFKKYWDRAVEAYPGTKSIQIKLFYWGTAYNPEASDYQESNIIWQVDCNSIGCWVVTNYLKPLPDPDVAHYHESYKLYINAHWLSCCGCGDIGNTCKWANNHCGGCFAPDASKSQNFVVCTKEEYGDQCGRATVVLFNSG